MKLQLPQTILNIIGDEKYQVDEVGMSASTVILFEDKVLKIESESEESDNEHRMLEWLDGKLPVPKVLAFEKQEGKNYLLMSKLPGEMSCDETFMKNPEYLTTMLAERLKLLWKVDISECPFVSNLDKKLAMAKYSVEHGEVNMEDAEPDTYGKNAFKNPEHLLEWLVENRPKEEVVLSHGDYCLPNVFINKDKISL